MAEISARSFRRFSPKKHAGVLVRSALWQDAGPGRFSFQQRIPLSTKRIDGGPDACGMGDFRRTGDLINRWFLWLAFLFLSGPSVLLSRKNVREGRGRRLGFQ